MKYLKNFENTTEDKCFWSVSTDEKWRIRLHKIGIPTNVIEDYYSGQFGRFTSGIKSVILLYVGVNETPLNDKLKYTYEYSSEFYYERGYKFMGNVKLTPEDIENYEIEKSANTYNL